MAVTVTVEGLSKQFGSVCALDRIQLTIAAGELFFLLGPSGCGKTTLLRCLAGFHLPDAGSIQFGGKEVTALPPNQRHTGMMFQSYALWPHMTLVENVAFGLQMRRVPRDEVRRRVMTALTRVHLADRARAKPNQLSGGEQQRVALARALVIEPHCLLLDEPLSNLDAKLRLEMRLEIRRICKESGITAIYVTHDQKEALSIADRVAVMQRGRIEQSGTPEEIYRTPVNRFVAGFIGEANFLDGTVTARQGDRLVRVDTGFGVLSAVVFPRQVSVGETVSLCLRPEAIRFGKPPVDMEGNLLCGTYRQRVYLGEVAQHEIEVDPTRPGACPLRVLELDPGVAGNRPGDRVELWVSPQQVIVTRLAATPETGAVCPTQSGRSATDHSQKKSGSPPESVPPPPAAS